MQMKALLMHDVLFLFQVRNEPLMLHVTLSFSPKYEATAEKEKPNFHKMFRQEKVC